MKGNFFRNIFVQLLFVTFIKHASSTTNVRLADGTNPNEGRVEILLQGIWGTVCNHDWDMRDANVVCRMLNYSGAVTSSKRFGRGSGPVWLTRFGCKGDEIDILSCTHSGLGKRSWCSHYSDAGIVCHSYKGGVQIRLAGGVVPHSGRVEVKFNNIWGTVHGGWHWDINKAHVFCRMMNYTRAVAAISILGAGSGKIWLDSEHLKCTGSERSIDMCDNKRWGCVGRDCKHEEDGGVICDGPQVEASNIAVRLVGGATPNQGRVEVRYYGVWGTICNSGLGRKDAYVICRMLNYIKPKWVGTAKVKGSGPILIDGLRCRGNETSIGECPYLRWGRSFLCGHSEDAGVVCQNFAEDIEVRLAGGVTPYSGRVEIKFSNTWGTIRGRYWGVDEANVVCRLLNYTRAIAAIRRFGGGSGKVWLSSVSCTGDEKSIDMCDHAEWGCSECSHDDDAGVICDGPEDPKVAVRLVGVAAYQRRLEVRFHGAWGTVCGGDWRLANVVCRMLNYSKAFWLGTTRGHNDSVPIILQGFSCRGNETNLKQCRYHERWRFSRLDCDLHDLDEGSRFAVECQKHTKDDIQVRLAGGVSPFIGRVEVKFNNIWSTIDDSNWDIKEANVVCRMLNYTRALAVIKKFGGGRGKVLFRFLRCTGEEKSIDMCDHDGLECSWCSHDDDVGVICDGYKVQRPKIAVRLVDGSTSNQGRLEVRHHGVWGTVCSFGGWRLAYAQVVCRMLNYNKASWVGRARVKGSGPILLGNVYCRGNEKSLENCSGTSWGQQDCGHYFDVGLRCENEKDVTSIRIIGKERYVGRVEVNYKGTWRPVCGDTWDIADAQVVCRILRYKAALVAISQFQVKKAGLWMGGVECSGEESSIGKCFHLGWKNTRCARNYSAGVMCDNEQVFSPVKVRLEEKSTPDSGRVAVRYGNVWGSICYSGFDIKEGNVICRMLGYVRALYTFNTKHGYGTIWLSSLECDGTEKSIVDCRHPVWGQTRGCYSKDAAAVVCTHTAKAIKQQYRLAVLTTLPTKPMTNPTLGNTARLKQDILLASTGLPVSGIRRLRICNRGFARSIT